MCKIIEFQVEKLYLIPPDRILRFRFFYSRRYDQAMCGRGEQIHVHAWKNTRVKSPLSGLRKNRIRRRFRKP